ncbi:MAG: adenylate/guanylate cyclase domain-containing protein [Alphaproteobacteria bacterium]|nr:adenylate/guanylate cyclase domain-containing protein [Alphaproteobacteria bacterium]
MPRPGFATFDDLVAAAWSDPSAELELRRRYEQPAAILVVDYTDMVSRSDHEGIVYALSLARAAEAAMTPALRRHGGQVVKRVADTVFAVFSGPEPALLAALDAQRDLALFNAPRTGTVHDGSRNDPIHASIGLGWGPTLVVPGEDLYGAEVNRAFVLGEDVGEGREVLCSEAFARAIGAPPAGVGVHAGPAARIEEAGFPFRVFRDHREA